MKPFFLIIGQGADKPVTVLCFVTNRKGALNIGKAISESTKTNVGVWDRDPEEWVENDRRRPVGSFLNATSYTGR